MADVCPPDPAANAAEVIIFSQWVVAGITPHTDAVAARVSTDDRSHRRGRNPIPRATTRMTASVS